KRLIDDPELTTDDLCDTVAGPDFPGGGAIYRFEEQRNVETGAAERVDAIRRAYGQGRSRGSVRGKANNEQAPGNRQPTNAPALTDAQPRTLALKEILQHHIDHRRNVVRRRTEHDLGNAKERAHILEGLKIAHDHIDELIKMIRAHKGQEPVLIARMREQFGLSENQAKAILEMQLRRLSGLERQKLDDEYRDTIKLISELDS